MDLASWQQLGELLRERAGALTADQWLHLAEVLALLWAGRVAARQLGLLRGVVVLPLDVHRPVVAGPVQLDEDLLQAVGVARRAGRHEVPAVVAVPHRPVPAQKTPRVCSRSTCTPLSGTGFGRRRARVAVRARAAARTRCRTTAAAGRLPEDDACPFADSL
jgi:hypothetical protein